MQHETFTQRVASRRAALSPSSRRIADYLVDAGPEVVLLSAAELATELSTSDASVIRTARALGYDGLDELRRAIAASSASASVGEPSLGERLRRTLAEGESGAAVLHAVIAQHVADITALADRVTSDRFERAVDVLGARDRIVWSGTGPSAAIAEYGAVLAGRLGRPSAVLRGLGTQLADELLMLRSTDAVVLLAYGRSNARARSVVDRAEDVKAAVVLITDTPPKDLSDRVSVVLVGGRGTPGLFSSHGTTVMLIEGLVLALAGADPARAEASLALLNELRASVTGRRRDVYRSVPARSGSRGRVQ